MDGGPRIKCRNFLCDVSGGLDANGSCINHCSWIGEWNTSFRFAMGESGRQRDERVKELFRSLDKHAQDHHGKPKQTHVGNGKPHGDFAFTLTAAPSDGKTEADMVDAVRKVMNQRSCPVKRYAWYLEYGNAQEKTHPHIHGMYETESGGVIEKKHWKRAWSIWDPSQRLGAGFRGGYHRPVRDDESYAQYIRKQKILGESIGCQDVFADPPAPSVSPVSQDAE